MLSRRNFLASSAAALAAPSLAHTQSHDLATLPPSIAALKNRTSEAIPITLPEREQRIDRARALMLHHTLDAIVITTGSSLPYFTGLRWGQSERLFAWVLPARSTPFIVCPVFEEGRVRERMSATPATLPAAAQTRVYTWNEDDDPYALLARALKDAGLATARIGIEKHTQFVFADGIAHSSSALSIVSATPVTAGCRSIKSPAELALMRLANQVTLGVYQAAFAATHPGMTNRELSGLIGLAYDRSGFPGEASCQVGDFSALPHGSLKPQVIRENQIILLDDGCTVEGYQSDISRAFVLGKATDRQKQVFDVVHKAQAAALAAARPGVPCHAIDDAARSIVTAAGFGPDYAHFTHRVGHGIGMDGHEWPYLVRGNNTPLVAGMTFSDEPGIYLPGEFGIRLEDDWYVTPDGAQLFTPQSPSLEHPF